MTTLNRGFGVMALASMTLACGAQSTPQLSPQAAYDAATRPIEIVHRSIGNWSDSEVTSLAVAIKNGAAACAARKAEDFGGDDLIAFARLCSLGQNWGATGAAAARYIESEDPLKPQLALAYGLKLDAALHARDREAIMATAKALLTAVPYDVVADAAINEALEYLQLAFSADALTIEGLREPILLAALKETAIVGAKQPLAKHVLYADGLAKAALEQYVGMVELAPVTVAKLDAALGESLPPDEALPVAAARRRYGLLGKPLPALTLTLSLLDLKDTPHTTTDLGSGMALLLFPEWCAQCVRMGVHGLSDATVRLNNGEDARLYALLAEAAPDKEALAAEWKRTAPVPAAAKKAAVAAVAVEAPTLTPAMQLLRTPTLVVPPVTLTTFATEDFPFLVVMDHAGIVRFAGAAPESALEPGDFLDRVVQHVAQGWPVPAPAMKTPGGMVQ